MAAGQTDRTWVNRDRTRRTPRLGRLSLQYFCRFEFDHGAESGQRLLPAPLQADAPARCYAFRCQTSPSAEGRNSSVSNPDSSSVWS